MGITNNPIGAEAAALLAAIHAESFPPNQAWDAKAIALMLGLPGHFGLLAQMDGAPAGFALGQAQSMEAEVLTLAVLPEARGKGVGQRLLTALLDTAAGRGAAEVFLEVAEANAPARRLYAKAGAHEVGRRRRYYADGADALVLRIDLT